MQGAGPRESAELGSELAHLLIPRRLQLSHLRLDPRELLAETLHLSRQDNRQLSGHTNNAQETACLTLWA